MTESVKFQKSRIYIIDEILEITDLEIGETKLRAIRLRLRESNEIFNLIDSQLADLLTSLLTKC